MTKPINVVRAHILINAQVYKEHTSSAAFSVHIPLTAHAKRRLGIPVKTKAFAMLLIAQPPAKVPES